MPVPIPTLQTPTNGSYLDLATGGTFTWTYNGYSGGQTGYHFRRAASGGSYQYWNAGSASWQSGDIANTSTAMSLVFGGGLWTDGITYAWSVATVDSSGTSDFAADFAVNAAAGPTVTITAPTGTITTQQPTVTWNDNPSAGAAPSTWRVVTYSSAQFSGGGFNPGTTAGFDDSGLQTGTATSYTLVTPLVNSVTYRSYVQMSQNPGGQTSAWNFTSYTTAVDSPAVPDLTVAVSTDTTTGCPRVTLVLQGHDNMLTANQASLINGATTGWAAGANTTISAVTTPTPPPAEGAYALQLSGSAGFTKTATTPTGTGGVSVVGGTAYTALASFQSLSTARSCTVAIRWYDLSGTLLSTSTSTAITDTSGSYHQALVTATSPATAAFAAVLLSVASASEAHAVVEIGLHPGAVASWSQGGYAGSTTALVLRSDGLYARGASPTNSSGLPTPFQSVILYDYECVPTVNYTYQAFVQVTLVGAALSSPASVPGSATIAGAQGWWELDPQNPASAAHAQAIQWNPSVTEQSSAHTVLGQATMNVVAYTMQKTDMAAVFETFNIPDYQGLIALATSQKTVFISDPFGTTAYYFRLAIAPGGGGFGSTAHSTQLLPSTASGPHRTSNVTGIAQPRPVDSAVQQPPVVNQVYLVLDSPTQGLLNEFLLF